MVSRKFHHGNLRAEMIDLAAQRIEEVGHEALSIRELATALGVSAGAPYRHFANKDELLRTLARNGLEQLLQAYLDAKSAPVTPRERLRMACASYLALALEKPQTFRLIFGSESCLSKDDVNSQLASYELFIELAADAFGISDRYAAEIAALTSWSTIHGFALLRNDPRLPSIAKGEEAVAAVLDRASGS